MDPRDRADAVLARAGAREGVVTPDNMTSPMDSANTQQIPRSVVRRIDAEEDPNTTTKLPSSMIEANDVGRESHLAEAMPTTPMKAPLSDQPDVTQPVQIPQAEGGARADSRTGAGSDSGSLDGGGLVPTTKTTQNQSYVARRLEGL
ncbi:hypothetical protein [Saccharomonospora cyanea]|nr:hypothetical protein [Saccharomonospora cyanea]